MLKKKEYKPEICDKLLHLFKDGSTVIEVCQALGITRNTYYQWKTDYADFGEAAEFAEEAAEAMYAKLGRMALASNGKFKIDTALYSFIMKTRFGYQEKDANSTQAGTEKAQPLSISFSVAPPVGQITVTNANECGIKEEAVVYNN
jgi:transcriptional regulator with XRE-family HTH domain